MQFGDLEFRFRWVPTLLLALSIPLFVALGIWQLDRAEQRRLDAQSLSERSQMPPLRLSGPIEDPQALRFRRLQARGSFEMEGQILIANRRQGNKVGFHVITPLRIEDTGERVLVNRGWIPGNPDGSPTPALAPERPMTVTGEAHLPSPPALVLHGDVDVAADWGKRWPYLTLELYAAAAGYPVLPVVILLDPENEGGFLRNWPRELPKEGMHTGYALQWFGFALIALVIWLRLSLTRRAEGGISA